MKLDVLICFPTHSRDSYEAFTDCTFSKLKSSLLYWDFFPNKIVYLRQKSRQNKYKTTWRILPNKSYEFYRCPRLDISDDDLISKIFEDNIND